MIVKTGLLGHDINFTCGSQCFGQTFSLHLQSNMFLWKAGNHLQNYTMSLTYKTTIVVLSTLCLIHRYGIRAERNGKWKRLFIHEVDIKFLLALAGTQTHTLKENRCHSRECLNTKIFTSCTFKWSTNTHYLLQSVTNGMRMSMKS
jgi:hypothetical protein